jgi:4-amino-4-deoxy-L-arabinose transferase-like glycosyltransferase
LGFAAIARRRPSAPIAVTAGLTLATIAASVVWSAIDRISQSYDPGRHLMLATSAWGDISSGQLTHPFRAVHVPDYPPLVHYLGALAMRLVGHVSVDAPVIALNLVFVPALAAGAFLAGRVVAGRWGGVAATAMCLGAPIVVSLTHLFLLDLALTSMVALGLGLLMASRHFALTRYAFAAGVVMGLGFLCKQTLPLYLAPFALAMVVRGGWRNPAGVAWAGVPFLALALPWYLNHRHAQADTIQTATAGARSNHGGVVQAIVWHAWSMASIQLLAPFLVVVLAGGLVALLAMIRRARPAPYGPELLLGVAGAFLLVGIFLWHDPRYSMPLLPLLVAVGVTLLTVLPGRWRAFFAGGIVAIGLVNAVLVNTGAGTTQLSLGASAADPVQKRLTIFSGAGYASNKPFNGGDLVGVLARAYADGVRLIGVDPQATVHPEFSLDGVNLASHMTGVGLVADDDVRQLTPRDALIVRRDPAQEPIPPCTTEPDGAGLYLEHGLTGRVFCP